MEERRKHIRLSKSLIISYRVKKSFLKYGGRGKNVSLGGICLPIAQRLSPGAVIELEIKIDDYSKPIAATGKIAWITKREDVRFPFEAGINFLEINPADKERLFSYIDETSKKEGPRGITPLD